MKVASEHHAIAEEAFKAGKNTPQVQAILKGKGLTHSQANDACRTARKHIGKYKSQKKEAKEKAQRAKQDANKQAAKKTEVSQDG